MGKESSEMKELSGGGLGGKELLLRLAKKEVKKEKEEEEHQQQSTVKGIEKEGEKTNGDNGQGSDVSSAPAHPSQPSSVNGNIHPLTDQPQTSVNVKKEGDSMVEELNQLREAAVTNERVLKGKELLLSMLTAKLEQVRNEKKAGEEQLMAEIDSIQKENSHQWTEFERRLAKEQQKNAQMAEELKLAKDKLNNMDKETATDMTTDHSVDKETSTPLQPSRAAIAAQLLGIDVQLLDEPQPNEWKKKFEELNVKYLKLKKVYRAEQKIATKLRKKLQDKEKDANTGELSLAQLGDADQQEPIEANEQQLDFELPPEEEEEEERVKEKETVAARRSAKAITIRGRRQPLGGGSDRKLAVPLTKRTEKKNGATNTVVNVPPSGVFKCSQCPARKVAFSSALLLAQHEKTVHGDRQHYRHQCQQCGQRCWTSANLERHIRTHTGEKPFKCRQCGKEFAAENNLKEHERVHTGARPHVCPVCQKAFNRQSNLTAHARVHSGETPFICQHCARQFKRSTDCRRHKSICPMRAHQSVSE